LIVIEILQENPTHICRTTWGLLDWHVTNHSIIIFVTVFDFDFELIEKPFLLIAKQTISEEKFKKMITTAVLDFRRVDIDPL